MNSKMGGCNSKTNKSSKKTNSTKQPQTPEPQPASVKVEKLMERSQLLGEAPHWDERTQALYFVSVEEKSIHKYDPATGVHTSATLEGRPGFIVPLEGHSDQFVVGMERKFVVVQWSGAASAGRVVREVCEVDQHAPGNRLNDGKADPRGRLYAGTMGYADEKLNVDENAGSLFRLDAGGATTLADQVSISNGMAWDLKAKAFYYIDSLERKIRRYDYDVNTGEISNLQYIFDLEENNQEGIPDGCTIDSTGNLWVAVFNGGCVLNISPTGKLLRKIEIPAKQVTSCTFGGAALDSLFVTTARLELGGPRPAPPAGHVFKVTGLGVAGLTNYRVKENPQASVKVEKLTERSQLLGEAPHWDERAQALYFVSVEEKSIHKYDPATGVHTSATLEGRPGFIVPLEGHSDQFLVGMERKFVVVQWSGAAGAARVVREVCEVDQHAPGNRLNDGKADPRGRLYAGTMGYADEKLNVDENAGSFFRLDAGAATTLADQVSISNGMAWDLKTKAFYYIDSLERKIRRYDYDVNTGEISNLQYIFDLEENNQEGIPDGCTIDSTGNLWVAVFNGGCVLNISPTGKLLRKIEIPAKQVTSCTFGGAALDALFVTTARLELGGPRPAPPAGHVFKVTGLGVAGLTNYTVKGTGVTI